MPVQSSEIATPRTGAQQQVAPTTTPPAINEADQLVKTNAYLEQVGEIIVTRQSVAAALIDERSGAVANLEKLAGDSSDSAALMRMFGGGYGKDLVRICGGFDQALDVAKNLDANTDQQLQGLQLLKDMVGAKFTEAEMGQFFSGTLPAARVEQLVDSIAARKLSEKEALEKQYGQSTFLDGVKQALNQEHEALKTTSRVAPNPQGGAIVTSSGEKIASLSTDRKTVVDKNGNETTLEALSKEHPQIATRALQNSLHAPNGLSTETLSPTVIDGVAFLDQHSRQDALNFVRKSSANAAELFNKEGFGNTSSQEHQKQLQALAQLREDNRLSFMGSTKAADILSYVDEGLSPGSVATGIFTGGSTLGVANTISRASGAIATDVATDGTVATAAILNGIDPRQHPVLSSVAGIPIGFVGALGRNLSSAHVPNPLTREANATIRTFPPVKSNTLINSKSSMAEDLATVPTMSKEDALNFYNQLGSNPNQRVNVVYDELAKLGWGRDTLHNNFEKSMSIIKNKLDGSKTEYALHGTSTHALNSILENGLNSLLGTEVNGGVMMRQPGAAYTTDIDYARLVADDAAAITGDEPLLIRWKLDAPEFKDKVGFSPPISADRLEISRDNGATWSRAAQSENS